MGRDCTRTISAIFVSLIVCSVFEQICLEDAAQEYAAYSAGGQSCLSTFVRVIQRILQTGGPFIVIGMPGQ
jgi:hypothetical protein